MENNRRNFLKKAGLAGMGLAGGGIFNGFSWAGGNKADASNVNIKSTMKETNGNGDEISLIGSYGAWAASRVEDELPALSYRRDQWDTLESWQETAYERFVERLAAPDISERPEVTVTEQYTYDGLHIEELSWKLPYGPPTKALLLKPVESDEPLPGILALHDHAGNKYFGRRKITRTDDEMHPLMEDHQQEYYDGVAWANEMARQGYVVLVPDAFAFASRRVRLEDVPEHLRNGLNDRDPENPDNIAAYNEWAADHEHVMAKSLFSAGTTWPGVFVAEDRKALDILCHREDVDESRIGCGGLSGGGLRTVYLAALDSRISCAVCVGFMTTWKDLVVDKSFTHTWMTYVPLLPNELDFPEILGLQAPQATLVLNNEDDALFTLSEMKKADDILKKVYQKEGAADRYKASFHPGPHKFDKPMQQEAFDWFGQWLQS